MSLELAASVVLTALAAALARKYKALDEWGLASALTLAAVLILVDARLLMLMMLFFATSSALTLFGYEVKEKRGAAEKRGGRGAAQVLCSGAVPAALAAISLVVPYDFKRALYFASSASMAYANADTWASEIGSLSESKPVLITNPRVRVPPGVSGGVTLLGELGALGGSATIAAASATLALADVKGALLIFICGWFGEVLDAFLGALIQAKYLCPVCNLLSDKEVHACGARAQKIKGFKLIKNEVVNLITELAVSSLVFQLTLLYL